MAELLWDGDVSRDGSGAICHPELGWSLHVSVMFGWGSWMVMNYKTGMREAGGKCDSLEEGQRLALEAYRAAKGESV